MTFRIVLLSCACWLLGAASLPPVSFYPTNPGFAPAADEYRTLWESDGPRIVAAMEAATGRRFPDAPIEIIVSEGRPMTSYDGRSMRLRASYSPAYKKATLVHEMGHRLALTLPRPHGMDDHRLLYLFLYDVWTDLYGEDFADRMVRIERRIGPDYDAAWSWALSMTRNERQGRLRPSRMRLAYDEAAFNGLRQDRRRRSRLRLDYDEAAFQSQFGLDRRLAEPIGL